MGNVRYIDIDEPDDAGQRLDNYLLRILKGVPRQLIYRIVRKGEVRVNGGRVKVNYRLSAGDRIRVPPIRHSESVQPRLSTGLAAALMSKILFEDDNLLIIDKPAGVAVHGGSNIASGVVETLRAHLDNPRLELVHRLDRDTSGCLALAKNRAALADLQSAFRQRQVKKIYELIVAGVWPASQQVVQLRLLRYKTAWGERRVKVDSGGQSARTDFAILHRGSAATWLQASLHTGRTHQIRVHASANGHAVLGDDKYATRQQRQDAAASDMRLCLHARKLVVPYAGERMKFVAPVPAQMDSIWQRVNGAGG